MEQAAWRIEPVGPLRGDVCVSGSKNAITKHMVAAILGESPSSVHNAPRIGDVEITAAMLRSLGVGVDIQDDSVFVDPEGLSQAHVSFRQFNLSNRLPLLLLGPLLHRTGEASVPLPGGDRIGPRPIDFHIDALRQMGAEIHLTDDSIEARTSRLQGARISFPWVSVMATETVLLAAVLAEGRTVIENAAIEPEVVELALFLQRMGARVEMRPGRRFVVEGVDKLGGGEHRLGGDRIEALSYLITGLATGGRVRVFGCSQDRLVSAISTLHRMGASFEITDEWVAAEAQDLRSAAVSTSPHPGFMTDWHPPLLVLFTQAQGMSVMHETIYEGRLGYADGLRQMGAEIETFDQCLGGEACRFHETRWHHSAVVKGPTKLHGSQIEMPDIRAAFAYLIATAAAEGTSVLTGVHQLERGYDRPLDKFADLGLKLTSINGGASG